MNQSADCISSPNANMTNDMDDQLFDKVKLLLPNDISLIPQNS